MRIGAISDRRVCGNGRGSWISGTQADGFWVDRALLIAALALVCLLGAVAAAHPAAGIRHPQPGSAEPSQCEPPLRLIWNSAAGQ
jgi:hypothetical protein